VGRTDKSLKTTLGFMADFGLLPHFNNESQTWVADDSGKPASSYYLRCRSSFGLPCIEIRRLPDTSVKAKHLGFGFEVADAQQFKALAALPGSVLEEVPAERGGGQKITMTDPDGLIVEVRRGFAEYEPLSMESVKKVRGINHMNKNGRPETTDKPLHLYRRFQAPDVFKLMHCAMHPKQLLKSLKWYQDRLGFIGSDYLYPATKATTSIPLGTFLRLDLGATPTDHHTFFLLSMPGPAGELDHCAFEVQDYDAVAEGHRFLAMQKTLGKDYSHGVGIGRHMLGAQIFDYWREPVEQLWEHATDSDRFTNSTLYPTGYYTGTKTNFGALGNVEITPEFIDEGKIPGRAWKLLQRVFGLLPDSSPEDDFHGLKGLRRFVTMINQLEVNHHMEVPQYRAWVEQQS
jgi:catechol 2,3-dioxygenase-like lactoylglutathione lyase family enzyme